ncbi:YaeQ family protein [Aurantivibrio infirmus]
MALKPTIYKAKINLSDINRDIYQTLSLTIAQHPSETLERMMVRVLAFCLNTTENLSFTKGLSAVEEPDIISKSLNDSITLWIDVGEPAVDRIKKATRVSEKVKIYSFNSKSSVWWQQNKSGFSDLNVSVFQVDWEEVKSLAKLVQRTMDLSVTCSENSVYFSSEQGDCEINWLVLQSN